MTKKDYRIIMTIAANLAKSCIWEGRKIYEIDLEQFVKAVDIYPDICIPVSLNGMVLNPKAEAEEDE